MLRASRSTCDIPSQYHSADIFDGDGLARRVNPLVPGIFASPCKRRPDTGRPCPLAGRDKGNELCDSCRLMYGGLGPDEEACRALAAVRTPKRIVQPTPRQSQKFPFDLPRRGEVCACPGCNRPPAGLTSPYCATCRTRIVSRVRRWYMARKDAGKPPEAYLYAKKQPGFKEMVW